jgi:hypothetical protein
MKQKDSERPIIRAHVYAFIYTAFTCKFIYIYIYIYILVKSCTLSFILKKCAIVTTDMHFSSEYVITKACLTHVH